MIYAVIFTLFFILLLLYFRVAYHYNIIDRPNERSSHAEITIRGAGIIFPFAAIIALVMYPTYWLPASGIFIVAIISFLDDRFTIANKIRMLFHLIAVSILFFYLQVFSSWSWYMCILLFIVVIGVINMYNFMDGINGITGAYSVVVLCGLQYVNLFYVNFIEKDMIWIPMLACLAFLYFNFRPKAKCFAGDVGSVSIAFWIIFLLLRLILVTGHWQYILFLVVYGIDSVLTVAHRLALKQNIFEAHRLHFYQLLVNEGKLPHLWVASGYALLQALIIVIVMLNPTLSIFILLFMIVAPLTAAYIIVKPKIKAKLN